MRTFLLPATLICVLAGCQRPEPQDPLPVQPVPPTALPPPAAPPDEPPAPEPDSPSAVESTTVPVEPDEPPAPALVPAEVSPAPAPAPAPSPLAPIFAAEPARQAFLEGRFAEAAPAFADIAARGGPHAAEARLLEALARREGREPVAERFEALLGQLGDLEVTVRLMAAEARLTEGAPEAAIAHLAACDAADVPEAQKLHVLRARALDALGRRDEAATAWKEYVKRFDARDATSLVAAESIARLGPDAERDAARILRGIIARSPHSEAAIEAEKRLAVFPVKLQALTLEELLVRLEAQATRRAVEPALETARRIRKAARDGDIACRSALLEARTLDKARRRRLMANADAELAALCAIRPDSDHERRQAAAEIAFLAAKAHRSMGDEAKAIERFTAVPDLSPRSSLGDDALVAAAVLLRGQGRDRAADLALERALGLGGDQSETAAFDLFWAHHTAGRLDQALAVARRAVEALPPSELLESRGRLPYWYARSLELRGEVVPAAVAYAAVIQRYPLAWYALLSERRLGALDQTALESARSAARRPTPVPTLADSFAEVLKQPAIARAVHLLRLDVRDPGRDALESATREVEDGEWLRAWVYEQTGDPATAYRIARWERWDHTSTFPSGGIEDRWRIANPRPPEFEPLVKKAAAAHGVEEAYVWAVMQTESGFRPEVVSIAKAVGLMQVIVPTGRAMAKREGIERAIGFEDLKDPDLNIRLGVRYLGRLKDRLSAHPALMAAGYNAGPGRPIRWLEQRPGEELDAFVENIPYKETRKYVKSVMTAYVRYRYLYEGLGSPEVAIALPRE